MNAEKNSNGKQLNWPTVVLVLATGAGNFFATNQGKQQLSYEQQEALSKIREIHETLDSFEKGMHSALANQVSILQRLEEQNTQQKQILDHLKRYTDEHSKQ
jgi:hypothetical protein